MLIRSKLSSVLLRDSAIYSNSRIVRFKTFSGVTLLDRLWRHANPWGMCDLSFYNFFGVVSGIGVGCLRLRFGHWRLGLYLFLCFICKDLVRVDPILFFICWVFPLFFVFRHEIGTSLWLFGGHFRLLDLLLEILPIIVVILDLFLRLLNFLRRLYSVLSRHRFLGRKRRKFFGLPRRWFDFFHRFIELFVFVSLWLFVGDFWQAQVLFDWL